MNTAKWMEKRKRLDDYKKQLLEVNPYLIDGSGIYVFYRTDENGFKYAYVGQARHVLERLAQHLDGFEQHVDRSIKKHGLFSIDNACGWFVICTSVPESELDRAEQETIKKYADLGYQLRNKTLGGQGEGKNSINEYKPSKGYYDGKKQGRRDVINELNKIVVYLNIEPANNGKLAARMAEKFWKLLEK